MNTIYITTSELKEFANILDESGIEYIREITFRMDGGYSIGIITPGDHLEKKSGSVGSFISFKGMTDKEERLEIIRGIARGMSEALIEQSKMPYPWEKSYENETVQESN